jgi:flagellar basal body rod protein FlgG
MLYGLYLSSMGAHAQAQRLDVLANNIANASTPSFKRDYLVARAHAPYDVENQRTQRLASDLAASSGGVTPAATLSDHSMGVLQPTTNPLDVAIAGPGYFQIDKGKARLLTRNGQFDVTTAGQLVTREGGHPVINTAGQPLGGLTPGQPVEIGADGAVVQAGDLRGQIAIVEPNDVNKLEKLGGNLYFARDTVRPTPPGSTTLRPGYLEVSGVNPVKEMMTLIETTRAFEANLNMIKHQDEAFARLLSSVPRR